MQGTKKKYRIALLGIYHESNTFIQRQTTLQDFKNGHWLKGNAIRHEYQHAYHEIGGMLEVLDHHHIEAVPIMFAEATPGGTITDATYATLLAEMMDMLKKKLPVDGCLVAPHGAGVTEAYMDMDGHWLSVLRKTVGDNIPIIGTLDPHANASEAMILATDALVAYKSNPHIDQRETGKMAAELMVKFLNKEIRPVQCLIQTPVAISIEQQNTFTEPCKSLYDLARRISQQAGILAISILLGFPYADVNEMGSSFIVVADNLPLEGLAAGEILKSVIVQNKEAFVGPKKTMGSQLPLIRACKKPVLLLEMGDNIGGGSPGDSAFLLKALEDYGVYRSFACIVDPEAVARASAYQVNETFDLSFGNEDSKAGGKPYSTRVTLLSCKDGKFDENNPRHGGQVNYDMGRLVIVLTERGNTVMLISLRVPPFSLRQLTAFEIDPKGFDIIVAKGVNAPIAAYGPVCPTIIQINTPGVTAADMTLFSYKNRRKPLFPFETYF